MQYRRSVTLEVDLCADDFIRIERHFEVSSFSFVPVNFSDESRTKELSSLVANIAECSSAAKNETLTLRVLVLIGFLQIFSNSLWTAAIVEHTFITTSVATAFRSRTPFCILLRTLSYDIWYCRDIRREQSSHFDLLKWAYRKMALYTAMLEEYCIRYRSKRGPPNMTWLKPHCTTLDLSLSFKKRGPRQSLISCISAVTSIGSHPIWLQTPWRELLKISAVNSGDRWERSDTNQEQLNVWNHGRRCAGGG